MFLLVTLAQLSDLAIETHFISGPLQLTVGRVIWDMEKITSFLDFVYEKLRVL